MKGLVLVGVLALATSPAMACDWKIARDEISPMDDARTCMIYSEAANLGVSVRGQSVTFLTGSAYRDGRDALQVRIDDNEAIRLGRRARSTSDYDDGARRALSEIRGGQRLRVAYLDYPSPQQGDAPICTLPQLIDSCLSP